MAVADAAMDSWCIVGAGAIGALMGARLAELAGKQVTLVARGPHLAAMRAAGGVRVVSTSGEERLCTEVHLAESLGELGTFDVVVLAVKAHQIAPIARDIERICHERSVILPIQNGLPWWYFYKHGGALDGIKLKSLDPTGELATLRLERVVGCIAFPGAEITAPGTVRHVEGRAFPLGEPDRSISPRAKALSASLERAGFLAPVRADFREEVWLKLLGNVCFNPVTALTGALLNDVLANPLSRQLCVDCMEETKRVAEALGCAMRVSTERRLEGVARVGGHKTSMLQDVEQGKALETVILSSVVEVADRVGVQVPSVRALLGLVSLLDAVAQQRRSRM